MFDEDKRLNVQRWLSTALTNTLAWVSFQGMKPMRASAAHTNATISAAASLYYYYGIARAGPD
jgi:hypothetical protein